VSKKIKKRSVVEEVRVLHIYERVPLEDLLRRLKEKAKAAEKAGGTGLLVEITSDTVWDEDEYFLALSFNRTETDEEAAARVAKEKRQEELTKEADRKMYERLKQVFEKENKQ